MSCTVCMHAVSHIACESVCHPRFAISHRKPPMHMVCQQVHICCMHTAQVNLNTSLSYADICMTHDQAMMQPNDRTFTAQACITPAGLVGPYIARHGKRGHLSTIHVVLYEGSPCIYGYPTNSLGSEAGQARNDLRICGAPGCGNCQISQPLLQLAHNDLQDLYGFFAVWEGPLRQTE